LPDNSLSEYSIGEHYREYRICYAYRSAEDSRPLPGFGVSPKNNLLAAAGGEKTILTTLLVRL
jgi:hypothetical protein